MSDIVDLSPESNGFDDMDADLEDYIGKLLWTFSLTDSFFWNEPSHFTNSASDPEAQGL